LHYHHVSLPVFLKLDRHQIIEHPKSIQLLCHFADHAFSKFEMKLVEMPVGVRLGQAPLKSHKHREKPVYLAAKDWNNHLNPISSPRQ